MKKVIVSFSVVALMLVGSVLNAQVAGCSSCGQQSVLQPSFAQPVSYSQPVVASAPTFAQSFVQPVSYNQPVVASTPAYAQSTATGCTSCGQQSFVQPVSYSQPIVATTPTYVQSATAGCTSCGQQSLVQPVSYSQPIVATTPTYVQPVATGCTSCGTANVANYTPVQASYVPQASYCSTCATQNTNTRGGLFRGGRSGGQGGLRGSAMSSRVLRAGLFNSIRN